MGCCQQKDESHWLVRIFNGNYFRSKRSQMSYIFVKPSSSLGRMRTIHWVETSHKEFFLLQNRRSQSVQKVRRITTKIKLLLSIQSLTHPFSSLFQKFNPFAITLFVIDFLFCGLNVSALSHLDCFSSSFWNPREKFQIVHNLTLQTSCHTIVQSNNLGCSCMLIWLHSKSYNSSCAFNDAQEDACLISECNSNNWISNK